MNVHITQLLDEEMTLRDGDGLEIKCAYSKGRKFVIAKSATQTEFTDVESGEFEEESVPLEEAVMTLAKRVPTNMTHVDKKFSVINSENEMFVLAWKGEDGNGHCLDVITG